jgi:hypothetical protein
MPEITTSLEELASQAYDAKQQAADTETAPVTQQPEQDAEPEVKPINLDALLGETPEQTNDETDGIQLSEGIDPETVVATVNGKPVKAGELHDSILMRSDYTKKTQEIAVLRKEAEGAIQFLEANKPLLQQLNSPNVEDKLAAIKYIAQSQGVDLSTLGNPTAPNTNPSTQWDPLDPNNYDESAQPLVKHVTGMQAENKALHSEISDLKKMVNDLVSGYQKGVKETELRDRAQQAAQVFSKQGLKDIDIDGALPLVGQPLTIEQALFLKNSKTILEHNARIAKQSVKPVPNEPGSVTIRPGVNGDKMSLEQYITKRLES